MKPSNFWKTAKFDSDGMLLPQFSEDFVTCICREHGELQAQVAGIRYIVAEMKQDRSGRTLEDYRELFWEAEKRIKELEAELIEEKESRRNYISTKQANIDVGKAVILAEEMLRARIKELEAKLDAVKDCKQYPIKVPPEPKMVMLVSDVLEAIGEQDE